MTDQFSRSGLAGVDRVTIDAGLRTHMQQVFNYMGSGLALTGFVAWVVAYTGLFEAIFGTPFRYLVILAPLGFVMFMNIRAQSLSSSALKGLFVAFCSVMGLSLSTLFLAYTHASIANAFFITAATFGGMSLWGYATKRDLTSMGSFLMMAVWGLIIASLVNLFMMSSGLQWIVSVASVIIFTGLTAYDVQRIKQTYSENWGAEGNDKLAVFGALSLYLDFINIFMSILRLTGDRRQ
jgi:uncharacterized protein